jgi:hypothetical protein
LAKLETQIPSQVKTHEQLYNYLDNGGIAELAESLEQLPVEAGDQQRFVIKEDKKEFAAYWVAKEDKRLLYVQSNLGRLAGLFLGLPVELEDNRLANGDIIASYVPAGGHPEPYLKKPHGLAIGLPQAVVKVQQTAVAELNRALQELA